MPIYVYECKNCSEKSEFLVGVTTEKEELKCKKCGSKNMEKIFASFSVGTSNASSSHSAICPTGTCPIK